MIYQGEERPIAINIANNSTPEVVADYQAIYVYLVNNRRKVAQYAFPETAGFELITFNPLDAGQIIFTLSQAVSQTLSKGTLDIEIKITQAEGARVVTKVENIEVQEALTRAL